MRGERGYGRWDLTLTEKNSYSDRGCPLLRIYVLLGSFSTDDGNGSENVTIKMSSRFFKVFLVYSNSLEMSKVGEFLWT